MNKLSLMFVFGLSFLNLYAQSEITKLSLNKAVETGLLNHPEIKKANENISISKGRFWSGISLPPPEIGVTYEYVPENSSLTNYGERTIEVNQSFEFPTNYFLKGDKYNKEEDIALLRLKQTETEVISDIKSSYFNVLAKKEQLKIAEENRSITEDFAQKAEIRYNTGEGTNIERLTAKVQYTEAVNNEVTVRNQLNTAYAELNFAMGYGTGPDNNFILTDSFEFYPAAQLNLSLEELYNLALNTNPDIKISELNINASSIDRSLAWSSLLPGFNLGYFKQSRDGINEFYGASFGLSVPLWFLFDNRGRIQEASAEVSIAETDLELVKIDVYRNLKNTFYEYQNHFKQVELYKNDILPQSEEVYRSASASYDAGEITYLEYLQARQTLINAKNNYINILYNNVISIYSLEKIAGQSLTEKPDGDE